MVEEIVVVNNNMQNRKDWILLTFGQDMTKDNERILLKDNGGRRSGKDRRIFAYAGYLPERRAGQDRRSGLDRRKVSRFQSLNK